MRDYVFLYDLEWPWGRSNGLTLRWHEHRSNRENDERQGVGRDTCKPYVDPCTGLSDPLTNVGTNGGRDV